MRVNWDLEHIHGWRRGVMRWLYVHTDYPEERFWEIYDKKWYDACARSTARPHYQMYSENEG